MTLIEKRLYEALEEIKERIKKLENQVADWVRREDDGK